MSSENLQHDAGYDPDNLLDTLIEKMKLKNDAALSRLLQVAPPVISKIRHRRLPVGASLLIRMHEETGMTVRELRDLLGDRRRRYRISDVDGKPRTSMDESVEHATAQANSEVSG